MNCDVCKSNEATVFLTQIVQGQMQKANLCEECAGNKGVTDPTGFALADLLAGIGAEQKQEAAAVSNEKTCSSCGFTQADFKKTGRLGCSHCFQVFGAGLESLLKAMHKGTRHVGKVPPGVADENAATGHLAELRAKLDSAIHEERYEDAAALRDKIHKLSDKGVESPDIEPVDEAGLSPDGKEPETDPSEEQS
ncbi:MAG: UvrB/UvrC motif-containing protein [Verrucomicrobiae bacterium]|nr:UvrB/UvrC motif-containing protein [Verrucomicrobiae bacterium]